MENKSNENLPVVSEPGLKEKLKSLLNKIMDFLFTNHSEGVVVAEFDEYGREIKKDEEVSSSEFDSNVINSEESKLDESEIDIEPVNEFDESLKVEIKTYKEPTLEKQRIEFIDTLEENPESLIDLSLDRLKKIEDYYDELIDELDAKIENCKKVS